MLITGLSILLLTVLGLGFVATHGVRKRQEKLKQPKIVVAEMYRARSKKDD